MTDFAHLDILNVSLSRERERVASAKSDGERTLREVRVQQIEKEITHERVFLGLPGDAKIEFISDDDLLAELGL
jgi:hypothetical protein